MAGANEYERGTISKIPIYLHVNGESNQLQIAWDSPSGKIYEPHDEITDCSDIRFWFEGFDALLYRKQMYPGLKLPFKLKDPSFELEVNHLGTDATITLIPRAGSEKHVPQFMNQVSDFINDFNEKSEAADRKYGLVHNWRIEQDEKAWNIILDSGSAGVKFYKSLLQKLSDSGYFEKVVMGG